MVHTLLEEDLEKWLTQLLTAIFDTWPPSGPSATSASTRHC
jgi:hypothetical protein